MAGRFLEDGQSFVVETTLSGNTYLRMLQRARDVGYHIVFLFVGTSSVEINFQRVKDRVAKGGHNVPEEDQRRRYSRSMRNMQTAFRLADESVIYDNSTSPGYVVVAEKSASELIVYEPLPEWADFLAGELSRGQL